MKRAYLISKGYLEKVKRPMDFGTIVQNLLTGRYNNCGRFAVDCQQVLENCRVYHAGSDEGASLCEQANRLQVSMDRSLGPLLASEQSGAAAKAREKAASKFIVIKRPEKDLLRSIVSELREATYTDKTVQYSISRSRSTPRFSLTIRSLSRRQWIWRRLIVRSRAGSVSFEVCISIDDRIDLSI